MWKRASTRVLARPSMRSTAPTAGIGESRTVCSLLMAATRCDQQRLLSSPLAIDDASVSDPR